MKKKLRRKAKAKAKRAPKRKMVRVTVPLDMPLPPSNRVQDCYGRWCTVPWTRETKAEAKAAAVKTIWVDAKTGLPVDDLSR